MEDKMLQPRTYFQLIEKVGSSGLYQRNICLIFFMNWFVGSLLLMGTSFMFLNPKINCPDSTLSVTECEDYVCSLPEELRTPFYESQFLQSLATQFGPFHCQKLLQLNALRMTLFAGTFFGYISVLFITDNYGRKSSMILSWFISVVGMLLLCCSFNIYMACVGLFLIGLGCQSGIRISMTVFAEVMENIKRQKYSTILQVSFGLGQIAIGLVFFLLGNWRLVTIIFCLIPAIVLLLFLIFYLEQTPKFLIKRSKQIALKSLNRIGKINKGQNNLITQQDIERVVSNEVQSSSIRTPWQLIKYKSQRSNFLFMSIAYFCLSFLYYGPTVIISTLSLNIYVSQVVMGISQTIAYPICYIFIEKSPRKLFGYIGFGIPMVLFFALIFIQPQPGCNMCFQGVVQIILVFIARFSICYYFAITFLFVTELFPLPLRGTGFGMVSACGAIATTVGQYILTDLQAKHINPMFLFSILSFIAAVAICFLPQTLGKQLSQNIPQQEQLYQGQNKSLVNSNLS